MPILLYTKHLLVAILLLTTPFHIAAQEDSIQTQLKNEIGVSLGQIDHTDYISPEEVSIGDWMTYVIATSFPQADKAVWLGDYSDQIKSKLPTLGLGEWSDYTIGAFLRPCQKYVAIEFYNECNDRMVNLMVGEAAGDSIKKYQLMDLPITGISYEQAMTYVAYMQDVLNTCDSYTEGKYRFECFLPTPQQFDSIRVNLDSINSQGCNLFNYKNSLCSSCPNGKKSRKHPVNSRTGLAPTYTWGYFPDPHGLKNILGNVAEMTSVKGVAKGGSYAHYASEAIDGHTQEYTGPALWLGFRVWYRRMPWIE